MKNPLKNISFKGFSEFRFWEKLKYHARQAGLKTVYTALLLFYAFKRKETPLWARRMILGVLAYFIAPIDALPDLTPLLGYTDDVGVLGFGLVTVACYINDDVRIDARKKLKKWFGELDFQQLAEVDQQL